MRQSLMLLALLAGGTVSAQEPVTKMYDDQVTLVEHEVVSLAEAMPAEAPQQPEPMPAEATERKPRRARRPAKEPAPEMPPVDVPEMPPVESPEDAPRRGWWQRFGV